MMTRFARGWLALAALARVSLGCGDDDPARPAGAAGMSTGGRGGSSGASGASGASGRSGTGGSSGAGAGGSAREPFDYAQLCSDYCNAAAAFQADSSALRDAGASDAGDAAPPDPVDASASDDPGAGTDGPAPTPGGPADDGQTSRACAGTNPDCVQSCLSMGNRFDVVCRDEIQVMLRCFVSDNSWFCDGTPSYPNPAACTAEQGAFGLCASQMP